MKRGQQAMVVLVVLLSFLGLVPASVGAAVPENQPIVVTGSGDAPDADLDDGVCNTEADRCSLRAAIETANHNRGADTIVFNLGADASITVRSALVIEDHSGPLTIDGYSEAGSAPNTASSASNAKIRIELDGTENEDSQFLAIKSPGNTIRGLALYGRSRLIDIVGENADGNRIVGNIIGSNRSSTYVYPESAAVGVWIRKGADLNLIGSPDLADRNIFAGINGTALIIDHGETTRNIIQNNLFGLSADGTRAMAVPKGVDIQWWSSGNLIGGFGPNEGNVFAGGGTGIEYSHNATGNISIGNSIGTTADGRSARSYTRILAGLVVKDDAHKNYFIENTVVNGRLGYQSRQNYTGVNYLVDNRFGVLPNGTISGFSTDVLQVRGHDDEIFGNVLAGGEVNAVRFTNHNYTTSHNTHPTQQTLHNRLNQNLFVANANDIAMADDLAHDDVGPPTVTGGGPGQAAGLACAGCKVEVYIDGNYARNTFSPGSGNTDNRNWIGTVDADDTGRWSIASSEIAAGRVVSAIAFSAGLSTSTFSNDFVVRAPGSGLVSNPSTPFETTKPAVGDLPGSYSPIRFECRYENGRLSWDDQKASTYQVSTITNGITTVVGSTDATSLAAPVADLYLVQHWGRGVEMYTRCDGSSDGSIVGTVNDAKGQGRGGVKIDLFNRDRTRWLTYTSSAPDGSYRLPVSPGCYVLTFTAPDGENWKTGKWLNKSACVDKAGRVTVDVALVGSGPTASSLGDRVLTQSGLPVADLAVELFASNQAGDRLNYLRYTKTDDKGAYNFAVDAGCYVVTFVASTGQAFTDGSRWYSLHRCVSSGESVTDLDATVIDRTNNSSDPTVSGTVSRSEGGVVQGVSVELFSANADGSRAQWLRFVSTDATGRYEYSFPPGCYVLTFVAPRGSTWSANRSRWLDHLVCVERSETVTFEPTLT